MKRLDTETIAMIGLAYASAMSLAMMNCDKIVAAVNILFFLHTAWTISIVAFIDKLANKYFMLVSSTIVYHIMQIGIIFYLYVKDEDYLYPEFTKISLLRCVIYIVTLMYFLNTKQRKLKRFIIKLIMLSNIPLICMHILGIFILGIFRNNISVDSLYVFLKILLIIYCVWPIGAVIYAVANRETEKLCLTRNESIALGIVGISVSLMNCIDLYRRGS
jgi:hypothetical protein